MKKDDKVIFSIRIDKNLNAKIEKLAKMQDRSKTYIVEKLLETSIGKLEK